MLPLAKFWTSLGNYFLPVAVAWAYFVRNGSDEGVKISRGYWGLAVSLLVGTLLLTTWALYIWRARKGNASFAPPNTAFEAAYDRHPVVSWGTVAVYILAVVAAIALFGSRYSDSIVHTWKDSIPLAGSFWESRVKAWMSTCTDTTCFAMGNRIGNDKNELEYVDQYIPYVTDPVLVILAILLVASFAALLVAFLRPLPAAQVPDI